MPIYEYKCIDCEHEMEKLQKISDTPLTDCPECGKPELKKMISAAGFRLKGSGWYETDFKNNSKSSSSKSDSATDAGSKKGSGSTNTATACCGGGCAASSD
ncbi:MAG: zinc ribbon domain-containing protein [Gammaproteobacteria bacterium]|nr:zinc ribbon domain-containing protein [Gammaproteobacteria bacterium]